MNLESVYILIRLLVNNQSFFPHKQKFSRFISAYDNNEWENIKNRKEKLCQS